MSSGNQDTNLLRHLLDENGGYDSALGNRYRCGLLLISQKKLPGFWWASQDQNFALIHPDHEIAFKAHRAMVDTKKLHILFRDVVADSAEVVLSEESEESEGVQRLLLLFDSMGSLYRLHTEEHPHVHVVGPNKIYWRRLKAGGTVRFLTS